MASCALFVLLAVVYAVSAQNSNLIAGKYEVTKIDAPAWSAYMKAISVDEAHLPMIRQLNTFEIHCSSNVESCNLKAAGPSGVHEQRLSRGKEVDATYFDGRNYKSTFEVQGNSITEKLDFGKVKSECKNMFSKQGLKRECSANDVKAAVEYKRV